MLFHISAQRRLATMPRSGCRRASPPHPHHHAPRATSAADNSRQTNLVLNGGPADGRSAYRPTVLRPSWARGGFGPPLTITAATRRFGYRRSVLRLGVLSRAIRLSVGRKLTGAEDPKRTMCCDVTGSSPVTGSRSVFGEI